MWDRGAFTILRWRGAPVRVHWSLALSALVLGRGRFDPGGWLGIVLVVLAHEFGHAFLVRRYRLRVVGIELHGMGGECRYEGRPSAEQVASIAWGGVLAQALLLPVGFVLAPKLGSGPLPSVAASFGAPSLWMMLFNLVPIPPLDGHQAWRLLGMWRRRWASKRRRATVTRPRTEPPRTKRSDAHRDGELPPRESARGSTVRLPDEVTEQLKRAVRRAYDEREPRK